MSARRILVVDDDPDVVEYVCTFLEDHDYETCSADSCDAALEVLDRDSVDLLVLDVMMPGRSGLDLLATLRKDARFAELPVLVLTGHDRVVQHGASSYLGPDSETRGPDGVLAKPLQRDELLRTLERLGFPASA